MDIINKQHERSLQASATAPQMNKTEVTPPADATVDAKPAAEDLNSPRMTFPKKLMKVIDSEAFPGAIQWSHRGDSFGIVPEAFMNEGLDYEFQGCKFESFKRKLNRWGFRRIIDTCPLPGKHIVFQHELFQRGRPELLENLTYERQQQASQVVGTSPPPPGGSSPKAPPVNHSQNNQEEIGFACRRLLTAMAPSPQENLFRPEDSLKNNPVTMASLGLLPNHLNDLSVVRPTQQINHIYPNAIVQNLNLLGELENAQTLKRLQLEREEAALAALAARNYHSEVLGLSRANISLPGLFPTVPSPTLTSSLATTAIQDLATESSVLAQASRLRNLAQLNSQRNARQSILTSLAALRGSQAVEAATHTVARSSLFQQPVASAVSELRARVPSQDSLLLAAMARRNILQAQATPASATSTSSLNSYQQQPAAASVGQQSSDDGMDSDSSSQKKMPSSERRSYQELVWQQRLKQLRRYCQQNGNCLVPQHSHVENLQLARWVKRQRYQYKLLVEGKPSNMTTKRVQALEEIGFIWDAHSVTWNERLNKLKAFRHVHKHCNVSTCDKANYKLATWVKCQRRQYKLYLEGKDSNLTPERILDLERLGFEWNLRNSRT